MYELTVWENEILKSHHRGAVDVFYDALKPQSAHGAALLLFMCFLTSVCLILKRNISFIQVQTSFALRRFSLPFQSFHYLNCF